MTVRICIALLIMAFAGPVGAASPDRPALIPLPSSVTWQTGGVTITPEWRVEAKGDAATSVADYARRSFGLSANGKSGQLRLAIVPAATLSGPEAYHLRANGREILIEAADARGLFYGVQTLHQLMAGGRAIPAADIKDAPRFRWRGLTIDVARHFFGKAALIKIIDEMSAYKLNVLKLHLTDYEGWRFEVPAYPRLTKVGALVDSKPQYFTTAELREIVAYAGERHIIVVPEIEMPGHSGAAARAYPEFFNKEGSAFNPANPKTYDFVRSILTAAARIFPAPYIHFGGDEVGDEVWNGMADVDQLKAEKGLKTSDDVEAYFGRKVVAIIESLGKRPMAWDEQVDANAPKSVVIQWWRRDKPEVRDAAARNGYDVVMSPADQLYFDYPQGPGEPGAPWEGNKGGPQSVAKMLAWEPVPDGYTPEQSAHVLGVEAALWTEFIATERYLQFMTFPRLLALAEIGWRARGPRDEAEFSKRLEPHVEALRAKGINARRGEGDAYEFITN